MVPNGGLPQEDQEESKDATGTLILMIGMWAGIGPISNSAHD